MGSTPPRYIPEEDELTYGCSDAHTHTVYTSNADNIETDLQPERKRGKNNTGWIIAVVVLSIICVIMSLFAFVPGVKDVFGGNDSAAADSIAAPAYLDVGMPLSRALTADGVAMSIVTTYDVGQEPVHTLYLMHNGESYETNVTDADGGWCYLTPEGKTLMHRVLSNSGLISDCRIDYLQPGAEIISASGLSTSQIQQDKDHIKAQLIQHIQGLVEDFYRNDGNPSQYLTASRMRWWMLATRGDGDPILNCSVCGEVSDEKFQCTDLRNGIVSMTYLTRYSEGSNPEYEVTVENTIRFNVIKNEEGDYLIDSWTTPESRELNRIVVPASTFE